MTKILYLIDSLPFGGAERQLSILLKYLPAKWETRVVSLGGGPYHDVLLNQKTSVAVYPRRSRFDLIPIFQLYREILRHKPNIIHSWGSLCSALVLPICKVLHILLIDGSIRIGGASNRHYWRARIALSLSDYIVANSYAGISAYKAPIEKSTVVYNAMDPDRLQLLKPKSNIQNDITKVIMTGRISRFKDFPLFFEAARRLHAQEPGCWKFVAIGAGEEKDRESFRRLAKDLVAAGVVDFPQAGLEVLPYLREANVGVLLSASCFKEGISNSIMEYMVCELPVICSDSGGNRELVEDGKTGFVIASENVDAFIEKLLFLRDHPDISCRMGREGHRKVTSLCSIERMIGDYEVIYTKLVGKNHKSRSKSIQRRNTGEGDFS